MNEFKLVKIIVIGDSGVGKTSLLNQYCYNKFDKKISPTIGCDFISKTFKISPNEEIKLQLWDIAGQESFQAISKLFIRGALGCIVVSDIMNIESINSSLKWKELVEENCDFFDGKAIPLILVQNKIDLLPKILANNENSKENEDPLHELVDKELAKKFAKENGFLTNVQVSAKENINLEKVFNKLIKGIQERKLIYYDTASNFGENDEKVSRSRSSLLELQRDLKKRKMEQENKECYC